MSRREARTIALRSLFAIDFAPDNTPAETVAAMAEEEDIRDTNKKDLAYAQLLVEGTRENLAAIDEELNGLSKEWTVERMAAVDRNLLRMAVYEMYYAETPVPAPVVINEVVELSKGYGSDDSPAFINGLLGALVKKHGA